MTSKAVSGAPTMSPITPSSLSYTMGTAALWKALWAMLNMTIPGAMNWASEAPGTISPGPPRARSKTARNSRLDTAGPAIDSTP